MALKRSHRNFLKIKKKKKIKRSHRNFLKIKKKKKIERKETRNILPLRKCCLTMQGRESYR